MRGCQQVVYLAGVWSAPHVTIAVQTDAEPGHLRCHRLPHGSGLRLREWFGATEGDGAWRGVIGTVRNSVTIIAMVESRTKVSVQINTIIFGVGAANFGSVLPRHPPGQVGHVTHGVDVSIRVTHDEKVVSKLVENEVL